MKKIIIFGATGNIGAYFTDYCNKHLDKNEYELIAVGRRKTSYFQDNDIKYIKVGLKKILKIFLKMRYMRWLMWQGFYQRI